jgi:acyl-CoA reductase-like NAD-dependent aldehyde dehydrogenase
VPIAGKELVTKAAIASKQAFKQWQSSALDTRRQILDKLSVLLEQERQYLVKQLAIEVGKPITYGEAEVTRAIELLKSVVLFDNEKNTVPPHFSGTYRYCPVGVVAIITPWNNPLAIPMGKIAPALWYGNTVVWKPALPGTAIAVKVMELLSKAGCPPGVINLVSGDRTTAQVLMCDENIDAVSLSGSSTAGYFAQEICNRRRIPLQAELGGNNAAIIWSDCDLENAVKQVSHGAFGFAGQRCTANRRVIVDNNCYEDFMQQLKQAMTELVFDDPLKSETHIGPVISLQKRNQVVEMITRVKTDTDVICFPDIDKTNLNIMQMGVYCHPTVICCDNPHHEIVQTETFAPVLVVQKAKDWEEAMQLCNGVKQGLVAALFSRSPLKQEQFIKEAQAGVLKLNTVTTDVAVNIPFGGWKASGVGTPEHGSSNREFYTRIQAIYAETN